MKRSLYLSVNLNLSSFIISWIFFASQTLLSISKSLANKSISDSSLFDNLISILSIPNFCAFLDLLLPSWPLFFFPLFPKTQSSHQLCQNGLSYSVLPGSPYPFRRYPKTFEIKSCFHLPYDFFGAFIYPPSAIFSVCK